MKASHKIALLTGLVATNSSLSFAQQDQRPHHRQGPPPQAIAACVQKAEQESCQFEGRRGTVNGQCRVTPHGKACVPEGRRGQRPPNGSRGEQQTGQQQSHRQYQARSQGQGQRRPQGGRSRRQHTVVQSTQALTLVPATQAPIAQNQISTNISGQYRILQANGIAKHKTGEFPNQGNPHSIATQQYQYRVPAHPKVAGQVTPLIRQSFGIAINGVPFDPSAAEFYQGNQESGWQYEALSGAVALGIDNHHAHVQPNGAYHYHGKPTGLLQSMGLSSQRHSPLIGWAADGFPIYAVVGYKNPKQANSGQMAMTSSWRIKKGARPQGNDQPGGHYDGTFIKDFEYVAGSGSLDQCNGRWTVTPEFPQGTYAYFITNSWPVIPRCYRGTPSSDFKRGRPQRQN